MKHALVRKSITGLALTGGLLAGSAGIAAATTGTASATSTPTATSTTLVCERAQVAWDHLKAVDAELHDHYAALVGVRDQAIAAGHTKAAEQLTLRLERVKDRHLETEARVVAIHDKVAAKCTLPEPALTELG